MADPLPEPTATDSAEGIEQLRELIEATAAGRLSGEAFIPAFQAARARAGRLAYRSKEEARLIWDVLWALEYYSPDPAREARPEEWNDARAIEVEIGRAARRLAQLAALAKRSGDSRFETFPSAVNVEQLRWYIRQTAAGVLSIQEFLADFRTIHERIEQRGRPAYASKEEAQAIWDVLWAAEYCSLDISHEENPEEWIIPEEVLMTIRRSARRLAPPSGPAA